MKNILVLSALFILPTTFSGCKKYLDKKPDQALVTPSTIEDLQALIDNNNAINTYRDNGVGEASSDNYYLSQADYESVLSTSGRSVYTWGEEIFYDDPAGQNEYSTVYSIAYIANTVLANIDHIPQTSTNAASWAQVKGAGYFLRAYAFSIAARNYSKAYDPTTAHTDLGIPLRLGTDFNEISVRASIAESYAQIASDLKASIPLLPLKPQHVMRPSRQAAYALLARVCLCMQDFPAAAKYADSSLQIDNSLIDFATDPNIIPGKSFPFPQFNQEVIFHAMGLLRPLNSNWAKIDSSLVNSYQGHDLRKKLFFFDSGSGYAFKGNYTGSAGLLTGIATDEVYLTLAEALARTNNLSGALHYLNGLMEKRWEPGEFTAYSSANAEEILQWILTERRKELLMRDLRWMDIKRLNVLGAGISITRIVNNVTLTLPPNDPRFALPLPQKIIETTGMPQNPR